MQDWEKNVEGSSTVIYVCVCVRVCRRCTGGVMVAVDRLISTGNYSYLFGCVRRLIFPMQIAEQRTSPQPPEGLIYQSSNCWPVAVLRPAGGGTLNVTLRARASDLLLEVGLAQIRCHHQPLTQLNQIAPPEVYKVFRKVGLSVSPPLNPPPTPNKLTCNISIFSCGGPWDESW